MVPDVHKGDLRHTIERYRLLRRAVFKHDGERSN